MSTFERYKMLKKRQNLLYSVILGTGLFLHLLLWDTDFLMKVERTFGDISAINHVFGTIWAWFRIYLVRGIGIWMLMTMVFLLFVLLPILVRYKHVNIRPSPWLAINVSVYFFLILKLLRVY